MSQLQLPQNFPIVKKYIAKLRREQPPSKTLYRDKYINSSIKEIQDTIKDNITTKLRLAAYRLNNDLITPEQYTSTRESIYNELINQEWVPGINDAFVDMAAAIDAYSLLETIALESNHDEVTFDTLEEYVNECASETISLSKVYQDTFSELKQNHSNETANDNNKLVAEIKQTIFVSLYPERPIPTALMFDEDEDNNNDLEVDGGKVDLTCPISRKVFKTPVKNKECIHTYDLENLRVYIRSAKICPECRAPLTATSCTPDLLMQARVEAYNRDIRLAESVQGKFVDETEKL